MSSRSSKISTMAEYEDLDEAALQQRVSSFPYSSI